MYHRLNSTHESEGLCHGATKLQRSQPLSKSENLRWSTQRLDLLGCILVGKFWRSALSKSSNVAESKRCRNLDEILSGPSSLPQATNPQCSGSYLPVSESPRWPNLSGEARFVECIGSAQKDVCNLLPLQLDIGCQCSFPLKLFYGHDDRWTIVYHDDIALFSVTASYIRWLISVLWSLTTWKHHRAPSILCRLHLAFACSPCGRKASGQSPASHSLDDGDARVL